MKLTDKSERRPAGRLSPINPSHSPVAFKNFHEVQEFRLLADSSRVPQYNYKSKISSYSMLDKTPFSTIQFSPYLPH